MRASTLIALVLTFTFSLTIFFDMTEAREPWPCKRCTPEECEKDPDDFCIWGETRNSCNRRICAKGPGERCGGPLNVLGDCGEGMMCKADEKCHGCSIQTMQCYP